MNKGKEAAANVPTPEESMDKACASRNEKEASTSSEKKEKSREESVVRRVTIDYSSIPIPVCSCTGVPHKCKKLPSSWRSRCCTATLSQFPLPLTCLRPKNRIRGRLMWKGTFQKLIERLDAEGRDLLSPIDLKDHWGRYDTNKYVPRVPPPVCSCTGVPRQCKSLKEAWQSICCTPNLSKYPLPSRRVDRLQGRTMTYGHFEKLLERVVADGHDLSRALDLKDHWSGPRDKRK